MLHNHKILSPSLRDDQQVDACYCCYISVDQNLLSIQEEIYQTLTDSVDDPIPLIRLRERTYSILKYSKTALTKHEVLSRFFGKKGKCNHDEIYVVTFQLTPQGYVPLIIVNTVHSESLANSSLLLQYKDHISPFPYETKNNRLSNIFIPKEWLPSTKLGMFLRVEDAKDFIKSLPSTYICV